ncbi:MAG: PAS domain-containing protein [Sulfuricurvum sp.]|nr:PAS domain-containing protein [Sulfuricurvum sp.]
MEHKIEIENFLELISTHLPDMLWAKDISGKYLFANKAICDNLLMASDTQEPIGKTDLFFALRERSKHPENDQWHTFGELCQNSDRITLEHMHPMRFEEYGNIRGQLVYLDVHKAPFYDKNGELIGVIGSGRDITLQKQLERELNTTKRLIESGPVVVFEWGNEEGWPIHYVSSNIDSVLGINQIKLLSKKTKFSDYIHPDDLEKITHEVDEYIKKNTTKFVQEYRIINESSQIIWIKDFTVVEYDEQNSLTRIMGYIFDDTARKYSDEQAKYLNHHDQLTGLPNRTKITIDIAENSPQGCAIFNIDSFREINDFFGVSAGDEILIQLAKKIQEMKIPAYRIGGDEFAVLFYQSMTQSSFKEHLEQLLSEIHEMRFTVADENINIR